MSFEEKTSATGACQASWLYFATISIRKQNTFHAQGALHENDMSSYLFRQVQDHEIDHSYFTLALPWTKEYELMCCKEVYKRARTVFASTFNSFNARKMGWWKIHLALTTTQADLTTAGVRDGRQGLDREGSSLWVWSHPQGTPVKAALSHSQDIRTSEVLYIRPQTQVSLHVVLFWSTLNLSHIKVLRTFDIAVVVSARTSTENNRTVWKPWQIFF